MKLDVLIKNGHVVDPAQNIDEVKNIGILAGKIVDIENQRVEPVQTVEAGGCYVFPGLIDFHTHIFYDGTFLSACPDFLLSSGVTAAVDAGSVGGYTFPIFEKNVIANSNVHVKAFVSCYSMGLGGERAFENFDPEKFDVDYYQKIFSYHKDNILGLKLRISRNLMNDLTPFKESVHFAEKLGKDVRLCVHITDPAGSMDEVMDTFRPGDVVAHIYEGLGNTILDENGKVLPSVWAAHERGVIFDAANGKMNFSIDICRKAMEQGLLPDIISTDMTGDKYCFGTRVRALPFVMSEFLSLGMSLPEVVRRTTEIPARLMGMSDQIGTLKPGSNADVSIFKLQNRKVMHYDTKRVPFEGNCLLIPQMTIIKGITAFGQMDFNLPEVDVENYFGGKWIE